ncbi:hypothetical protein Acr_19g0003320 [Actinidia rufa]|uniref:Uncharacterized protein n=1 Tax=Actinidia rufa TaxID=165716 RepID=A0A7J0G9B4_9ERIC|nr:hypothetical protein Acr_19g0003320 [Actinidia rufa]
MGAAICGFGQMSPKRLPNDQSNGLKASIMEFLGPKCLWREKKKITQLHHQEKQQKLLKDTSFLTLEEWLLASPGPNNGYTNGGDFCAFKQSSKRVHPSLPKEEEEQVSSKSRERVSVEREAEVEDSSLCRSQSGKKKKKVSFRLPEVADIIVFRLDLVYGWWGKGPWATPKAAWFLLAWCYGQLLCSISYCCCTWFGNIVAAIARLGFLLALVWCNILLLLGFKRCAC